MAEVKATKEEQERTLLLLTCSPISAGDPPIAAGKSDENDAENCRQTKRRKSCPSALEKSFSFDTNSKANTLQFTPKFGSFKLTEPPPPADCVEIPASKKKEDKGFSSADHVISNGD